MKIENAATPLPDLPQKTPETLSDLLELTGRIVDENALKRLRRRIHERERQVNAQLIYKPKGSARYASYRLHLPNLRKHMPELWPAKAVPESVHQIFARLEYRIEEIARDVTEQGASIEQIKSDIYGGR